METFKIFRYVLVVLALAGVSQASFTYSFVHFGDENGAGNAQIGEDQLSMEVSDYSLDQVLFTFYNSGPYETSVTQIYFEDTLGLLDGVAFLIEDTNFVDFDFSDNAGNLPGGNTISFTEDFEATSVAQGEVLNGKTANGINPGEQLGVVIDLEDSIVFNDIISALDETLIRVGMHVQAFPDGSSNAFVNNGRTPIIPAPGAFSLAMIGVAGLGYFRKKK